VHGAGWESVAPAIMTPAFADIVETISIATKQVVVIQPLSVVIFVSPVFYLPPDGELYFNQRARNPAHHKV
jgi:hypothetical protein